MVLQIFRLFVHRPPWNLTSNVSGRQLEAKVGSQVVLTCSAKGNPKPKITWKRLDNKKLRIIDKRQSLRQGKNIIVEVKEIESDISKSHLTDPSLEM